MLDPMNLPRPGDVQPIVTRRIPLDGLEEGLRDPRIASLFARGYQVVTTLVIEERGIAVLLLVFGLISPPSTTVALAPSDRIWLVVVGVLACASVALSFFPPG